MTSADVAAAAVASSAGGKHKFRRNCRPVTSKYELAIEDDQIWFPNSNQPSSPQGTKKIHTDRWKYRALIHGAVKLKGSHCAYNQKLGAPVRSTLLDDFGARLTRDQ